MLSQVMSVPSDEAIRCVVDAPQDWEAFSRPCSATGPDAGRWESALAIEGMYCASCSLAIESALLAVPGVSSVSVNAASQVARVVWSPEQTRPSEWLAAVARIGYRAVPAQDMAYAQARAQATKTLLWRWLVAGFCMMQVMMYALPAYTAGPGEISAESLQLLRWASWVLTLPVILFSCRPFFASAWFDLRHGRIGMDVPVSVGIVVAFLASTAATLGSATSEPSEVWFDSLTMLVFFLLSGRMLEARLRDRTAGALASLARRLPDSVLRQQPNGEFERVAVTRVAVGDILRIYPGEAFPADGELVSGETQVDEALLTGESNPLRRGVGAAVIAGSFNLSGVVTMQVKCVGDRTRYAAIVALMQSAAASKPASAALADRIARPFLIAVMVASAASAAWWWPSGASHALGVAIAVLVVTCPCALSLATPAATLATAGLLARAGTLVRHLGVFETLTKADAVVFDKTGTLTENRMSVQAVRIAPTAQIDQIMRWAQALASQSLHPVAKAVSEKAQAHLAQAPGIQALQAVDLQEVVGQGLEGTVTEGGNEHVVRLGSAAFCGAKTAPAPGDGLQAYLSVGGQWLASFEIEEVLRSDAAATVRALKARGLQVLMLSGDHDASVKKVAQSAGIDEAFGGCSPHEKMRRVMALQRSGKRVVMVGDGINDAPVIAAADVSVALGSATALTQSKADVVVMGERLEPIVGLITQAHRSVRGVHQNLIWAGAYNAVCVPLAIGGYMPPWLAGLGMALSSLVVVANAARLARPTT